MVAKATFFSFLTIQTYNITQPNSLISNGELWHIIQGCTALNRDSQKKLYNIFYGYAMSVSLRYAATHDDALEIVNDGFLKLFKEIRLFKPHYDNHYLALKGWVKQLMIFTAIDHYRKNAKHQHGAVTEDDAAHIYMYASDKMSFDEIRKMIQQLSPAYRTVFNLFVIDGFSHEEIARQLGISVGTSKSNLSKAKMRLQQMLLHLDPEVYGRRAI